MSLDIFNSDAFSLTSLTDAINKVKFVPGLIGQSGLFQESPVATTTVWVEEQDHQLVLVNPSPRGAPGETRSKPKRQARNFIVPHFEIDDAVMAEEVQNVRPFGSETGLMAVQQLVANRMVAHSQAMESTLEHARIGAVKGIVTYADGTTLNLFTEMGVTAQSSVDFDLDNASPASGALRIKCNGVLRAMARALDGIPFSGAVAFCGDNFFDYLTAHPEVRNTFLNWTAAADLRQGLIDTSGGKAFSDQFSFGGISWVNYRGAVAKNDGSTAEFVDTDSVHIAPIVPGLFRTVWAPADYVETVNTMGRRLYAKQYPMPNGKGISMEVQMNALSYCVRPNALVSGVRT